MNFTNVLTWDSCYKNERKINHHSYLNWDAFAILESFPIILDFINTETSIYHFRKSPQKEQLGSSTNILRIGSSLLRNIHIHEADCFDVIDFMVHESIHNFIGKYEHTNGFLINLESEKKNFINSAWTGNKVYISSYSHAIFVWFSLNKMWKLFDQIFPNNKKIKDKLYLSSTGFLKNENLENIFLDSNILIQPGFIEQVQFMQENIKGQT